MRSSQTRKLLIRALGLILLGSLCFWFAPSQFGGETTYVVTHGISMEPRFHTGDLALVRSQSSYHVGEIVAYDSKMLHTVVLHRIIGRDGARYVFKGDNNNFIDPEHPKASQLVGALWLHIPGAGATLLSIRSPLLVAALIAVGLLILTGSAFARRRRLRRRERRGSEASRHPSSHLPHNPATPAAGIVAVGLLLFLPFLVLALVAFTSAPTARRPYTLHYKQSGALSYTAEAPPGPTYPEGKVTTGEPLFTKVVKAVEVAFDYRLQTTGRHTLGGTASLGATVVSSDGWHTTLELAPKTPFHGSRARIAGTLNLASLLATIRAVQKTTSASGSYTLTLLPKVTATGTVDALPIQTKFAPKVSFTLSELEAQPAVSNGSSSSAFAATTEPSSASQFTPRESGTATGTHTAPAKVSVGIATLSVTTARKVALTAIALIVALVLLLLLFLRPLQALLATKRPHEEAEKIRAKFGRFIVPVERVWQLPGVPVIDVADIAALAQIAEHYDRSILEEQSDEGVSFWVTDESGQFRYALGAHATAATPETVETAPARLSATDPLLPDPAPKTPSTAPAAPEADVPEERSTAAVALAEPDLSGPIEAFPDPRAHPRTDPPTATWTAPAADDAHAVIQGEWTPRRRFHDE
jgi:signal peptidase I